jgi:hypothetical protein
MPRTDDSAAHAANWRTLLVIDAGLGVVAILAGAALALAVNVVVGTLVLAVGAAYTSLVASRARRWIRLRRQAGR